MTKAKKLVFVFLGAVAITSIGNWTLTSHPAAAQAGCACGMAHRGEHCGTSTGQQHGCSCDNDRNTNDVCR
jgi:hypothetical protein